jgi:hypothetical protein
VEPPTLARFGIGLLAGLIFLLEGDARAARVRAFPGRLVLGVDAQARLEIRAQRGARLRPFASVGAVADLREVAPGRWTATYTPPPRRAPQVAIVAFRDEDGDEIGFTALPLFGRQGVRVETRPSAKVSMHVAGVSFPPVRADAQGRATLPIQVPPGVTTALLVAVDAKGHETRTQVDLRPPPFGRILLLPPRRSSVIADGKQRLRYVVIAVDPKGALAKGLPIRAAASLGAVGEVRDLGGGAYQFSYRPPVRGRPGRAVLTVALEGDSASRATHGVALAPVVPRRFARISLQPPKLAADGRARARVLVVLDDGRGLGIPGERLKVEASGGEVGEVEDQGAGRYLATYTAPRLRGVSAGTLVAADLRVSHVARGGRPTVPPAGLQVLLEVPGAPAAVAAKPPERPPERPLVKGPPPTLIDGRPVVVEVRTAPARLRADGRQRGDLLISLRDLAGAAVSGQKLVVEPLAGSVLGQVRERAPGTYSVQYRAPRFIGDRRVPVPVTVVVTSANLDFFHRDEITLTTALLADVAPDLRKPGFRIGPYAAGTFTFGGAPTIGFTVGLDLAFRLPVFDHNLFVSFFGGAAFGEGTSALVRGSNEQVFFQQRVYSFLAGLHYRREVSQRVALSLGLELGAVLADVELGGRFRGDTQRGVFPALQVPAALEIRVGGGAFPFEVRYLQSLQGHEGEGVGVRGSVQGLLFALGYRHYF